VFSATLWTQLLERALSQLNLPCKRQFLTV
jgi:hypothetical protein